VGFKEKCIQKKVGFINEKYVSMKDGVKNELKCVWLKFISSIIHTIG
jgi:hypothetical protein